VALYSKLVVAEQRGISTKLDMFGSAAALIREIEDGAAL
jgi:hypothetical protein